MTRQLKNQTFFLGQVNEAKINFVDPTIYVTNTENVILPVLLLHSKDIQILLCVVGWCLMVIGSYFRLVVYKHLFDEYRKKKLTPINVLILFSCLIQQLGVLSYQIYETLVVLNGENLENLVYYGFCHVIRYIFGYEMLYSIVGGFGIALYRLLLIKQNELVKYKIGENNLLYIILSSGLLLVLGLLVMLIGADNFDLSKNCIIVPGVNFLNVLGAYQQSSGVFPSYYYQNQIRPYFIVVMLSLTLAEIFIYLIFFWHFYKHDNSESLRKLLEPKIIKQRNKRNALTFFSQFCTFIFEISFIILMLLASFATQNPKEKYLLATFLKKLTFASIAMIEVFTSRRGFKIKLF